MNNEVPLFLSITQAANLMGLGRNYVSRLVKNNILSAIQIPGYKHLKICINDINNLPEMYRIKTNKKNK
ncbi:MAG: excisionase family DNA-binding protein [Melioribacteraceae bacterium]